MKIKAHLVTCSLAVVLQFGADGAEAQTQTRKNKPAAPKTAPATAKPIDRPAPPPTDQVNVLQAAQPVAPKTVQSTQSNAKKPGVIRVAVATPKVQLAENPEGIDPAVAVRNTFGELMKSKTIEVVTLESRLPVQISEEARDKGIDYLLYTGLSQKKSSSGGMFSGGGMLGKMAGRIAGRTAIRAASSIPGGGLGEEIARDVAVTAIYTAADLVRNIKIKEKDEFTLEYKLMPVGGAAALIGNSAKAKAKADGEDIITPLIESAANSILTAIIK